VRQVLKNQNRPPNGLRRLVAQKMMRLQSVCASIVPQLKRL
jgi:hypothetical protein